jgi:D-alanine-D-alanine ligase
VRIGIAVDLKNQLATGGLHPPEFVDEYDAPETVAAIAAVLQARGHEPFVLGGGAIFARNLLAALAPSGGGVDLIFNIAEGRFGARSREAQVPALCDLVGVPVTHSDATAMAVAMDKALAKRVVASHGVATPPFALLESAAQIHHAALPPLPVVVKPNAEGSSIGVDLVRDRSSLVARVADALERYRQPVLVEAFLPGMEVTVAILGTGADARVVGAMEIAPRHIPNESFMYSRTVKHDWEDLVDYHVPPRLSPDRIAALEAAALTAYRAIGCRGVARLDLRLNAEGAPNFIEINPLPGLHPEIADLSILCRKVGMDHDALVMAIVDEARFRVTAARVTQPTT